MTTSNGIIHAMRVSSEGKAEDLEKVSTYAEIPANNAVREISAIEIAAGERGDAAIDRW